MALFDYLRNKRWASLFGYILFIGLMSVGYYYNLTFVQLGLKDLGERVIGMSPNQVAFYMALLAGLTVMISLITGTLMTKRGWGANLNFKLRIAFMVMVVQTALTGTAPFLQTPTTFLLWIISASLALGVGVPAMFGMTVDFIPRRDRGYAAALITALAYFFAAAFSGQWQIDILSRGILWLMLPGTFFFGLITFADFSWKDQLLNQHRHPDFAWGRFVYLDRNGNTRVQRQVLVIVGLMFGIFFIDSLGFLRLLDTPVYVETAWQSPDSSVRLFIAGVHVIAALLGGILYSKLNENILFFWIFGIFTLVHFTYRIDARFGGMAPLGMPMLYAIAVSLYTVVNFAIWADLSTPRTISINSALGVSLSGWTATFLSTALAIQWFGAGMSLESHLQIVNALSLLFFTLMILTAFLPKATLAVKNRELSQNQ